MRGYHHRTHKKVRNELHEPCRHISRRRENNKNAFRINEIIKEQKEKKKDISPLIEAKFVEFKQKYSNIFGDIFYFLMLKKIICPNCNNIMEERVDFEYDIDFYNKGLIKELFVDYFKAKEIVNISKEFNSSNPRIILEKKK